MNRISEIKKGEQFLGYEEQSLPLITGWFYMQWRVITGQNVGWNVDETDQRRFSALGKEILVNFNWLHSIGFLLRLSSGNQKLSTADTWDNQTLEPPSAQSRLSQRSEANKDNMGEKRLVIGRRKHYLS